MAGFNLNINHWLNFLNHTIPLGKVIAFFLLWGFLWLPLVIPLAKYLNWSPFQPLTDQQKLPMVASLYLLAPLVLILVCWGEERLFWDYGLRWQPSFFLSLLVGISGGIGGLVVIFGLKSWLGWIQWNVQNIKRVWKNFIPLLGLGLWIAITEELIFRGFLVDELSQNYSILIAAVVSSLIFAVLHLVWERQKTIPQLPGLILMGLILVFARQVDGGSLGLAWGLHTGWILGLASLDSAEMVYYTGKGSQWTLGQFEEPLAGIISILGLLGTGASLWILSQMNNFGL